MERNEVDTIESIEVKLWYNTSNLDSLLCNRLNIADNKA